MSRSGIGKSVAATYESAVMYELLHETKAENTNLISLEFALCTQSHGLVG